jgi:hypothetical protein
MKGVEAVEFARVPGKGFGEAPQHNFIVILWTVELTETFVCDATGERIHEEHPLSEAGIGGRILHPQ